MGNIRNKMIEEFLNTDIQVGESVSFKTEVEKIKEKRIKEIEKLKNQNLVLENLIKN